MLLHLTKDRPDIIFFNVYVFILPLNFFKTYKIWQWISTYFYLERKLIPNFLDLWKFWRTRKVLYSVQLKSITLS